MVGRTHSISTYEEGLGDALGSEGGKDTFVLALFE